MASSEEMMAYAWCFGEPFLGIQDDWRDGWNLLGLIAAVDDVTHSQANKMESRWQRESHKIGFLGLRCGATWTNTDLSEQIFYIFINWELSLRFVA